MHKKISLLAGSIDYAGLFPPAKLPLETAVANYTRYVTEPDAFNEMLLEFLNLSS